MKPTTYLEKHLQDVANAYGNVDGLREHLSRLEAVQRGVHEGKKVLTISAEYGQYPVFDTVFENRDKLHIVLSYTGGDAPVPDLKRFKQFYKKGWGNEKVAEAAEKADPPVKIRFKFLPKIEYVPSNYENYTLCFEEEIFQPAPGSVYDDSGNTMRNDFVLFIKALSWSKAPDFYIHQDVIPSGLAVDKKIAGMEVMNVAAGDYSYLAFQTPEGLRMTGVQRADYVSKVLALFFRAKGYTPVPKDVGAAIQEWHDSQGRRIDGVKVDLEQAVLNLEKLNTQGFSENEVRYLAQLTRALKDLATQYLSLKETLGDDIVFDPLGNLCQGIPNLVPSERFRLLSSVIDGLKAACQKEDGENFLKKFKAIVTFLSNLEKSIRGDDGASSGAGWEWTEPLLLTTGSTT